MRKLVRLPLRFELVCHPSQTVLNVHLEHVCLKDWCLGLALLKEGLTDVFLVGEERGKRKLEIQVVAETKSQVRAQAIFGFETIHLKIILRDLDYLLHFFLKYYRDGIAEVDHLDLEVVTATENQEACVTFKVSEANEPLTEDEAKRRLGLA